jgi:hypothetical protein
VSVHPLAQLISGDAQLPELVLPVVLAVAPPPWPLLVNGAPQPKARRTTPKRRDRERATIRSSFAAEGLPARFMLVSSTIDIQLR